MRRALIAWSLLLIFWLAACQVTSPGSELDSQAAPEAKPEKINTPIQSQEQATIQVQATHQTLETTTPEQATLPPLGYTHHRADGNRLISGSGALPDAQPLDIPLGGKPIWVSAVPLDEGALWAVVLDSFLTQAFFVVDSEVTPVSITPSVLLDTSPLLMVDQDGARFVTPPINTPGGNNPVRLNEENDHSFSNAAGRLFFLDNQAHDLGIIEGPVLPDGRLLVDENGRLLVLADPTNRYDHGVLGDEIEAASIILIEARPELRIVSSIPISGLKVIEGIAPIWTDWDGDGVREIIVTISDLEQGAQIVIYSEEGEELAAGPAIGNGYRWRHQIAVAPFGPNGEMELVDVLTPHIGGVVEFYQWMGSELRIVAQLPGFTSHVMGSRNLDMAAAADFDGDGRVELLLPDQARSNLGGIRRTTDGAEVAWTVPVGSRVSSNLGAVTLHDGRIAVGIGREDETLRIWQP
jgi:hypothetical protein